MVVHRLGHLDETVRAADAPRYREILVRLPERLLEALDEHIINRVHDGELRGGAEALASEREAHLTLAVRSLIDYWPDLPPAARDATPAGRRSGPPASQEGTAS